MGLDLKRLSHRDALNLLAGQPTLKQHGGLDASVSQKDPRRGHHGPAGVFEGVTRLVALAAEHVEVRQGLGPKTVVGPMVELDTNARSALVALFGGVLLEVSASYRRPMR